MHQRPGFTLFEIIVVLFIIGVCLALAFPSFTNSTEQALALTAKNNLLAIYSAEKNYYNNNGSFCGGGIPNPQPACAEAPTATCGQDIASINCNLSLNIQDDGSYTYQCLVGGVCEAMRVTSGHTPNLEIEVQPTLPIQSTGAVNPSCFSPSGLDGNWCP